MTLRWPLPRALPANVTMHLPMAPAALAVGGTAPRETACGEGLDIEAFFAEDINGALGAPDAFGSLGTTVLDSVAYLPLSAHNAMPIAVQAGSAPSSPTKGTGAIASHTTMVAPELIM
jgi:hypothetical protein